MNLKQDIVDLIVAKVVTELEKKITAKAPAVQDLSELRNEIKLLRYLMEMQYFSDRNNLYATAREMDMGSEIYFAAESGLLDSGGSASWVYLVPDKMVDIAERLGYDPSSARVINFIWERDGDVIYEDPKCVRREDVEVYKYTDEAYDYCKIIVENTDTVNKHAIHVWGFCHFIDQFFYDMIKRRMTTSYPLALFPEIYKQKERPGL